MSAERAALESRVRRRLGQTRYLLVVFTRDCWPNGCSTVVLACQYRANWNDPFETVLWGVQLRQLRDENLTLELENTALKRYYERHVDESDDLPQEEGRGRRRGKGQRKMREQTITLDQKLEIVSMEVDEAMKAVELEESATMQALDTLRAVTDAVDEQMGDIRKEAYEFRRDIGDASGDHSTGKPQLDRVVRWVESVVKKKETQVQKLQMKARGLKTQQRKLQQQLKAKEEMGDVLHYIDFHQLQIENKQYLAKIEERNAQLLELKMSTGHTVQRLNDTKTELNRLMHESQRMRHEIRSRTQLLERLRADQERVSDEMEAFREEQKELREAAREGEDLPHTLDFVNIKANHDDLEHEVQSWKRKVEIAEMGARRSERARQRAEMESARRPTGSRAVLAALTGKLPPRGSAGPSFPGPPPPSAATRSATAPGHGSRPAVRTIPGGERMGRRGQLRQARMMRDPVDLSGAIGDPPSSSFGQSHPA